MSSSILVTYATRYSSTQEVADAIAKTLRDRGLIAEALPVHTVTSIVPYDAVVLGAPIYYDKWHKDALRFLSQHCVALITRPVAVFALGPLRPEEAEMKAARSALDKALAGYSWLSPVATEVFLGKYDPANLRFPDSLLLKLPASPFRKVAASDLRDWPGIRAWAEGLVGKLQGDESVTDKKQES
ncbi:MAG TPA: flavodoxin domain-containing protein [Acidisarcina sp.]|nr:flavodoxin domain-containing protein [Acidisarcina sp.]